MKKLLSVLILILLLSSCEKEPLLPRVGDTEAKVIQMLGKPDEVIRLTHSFGDLRRFGYIQRKVTVELLDDRVTLVFSN